MAQLSILNDTFMDNRSCNMNLMTKAHIRNVQKELVHDDFSIPDTHSGLDLYLQQVKKIPRLENDEKIKLLKAIRRGQMADASNKEKETGKAAWNRMILCHLYMVVNTALSLKVKNVALEDLIQEGNIGLINALANYDERCGQSFRKFANVRISKAVWNAIINNNYGIRVPPHTVEYVTTIRNAIAQYRKKSKKRPTYKELVELTGYSLAIIERCEKAQIETVSLDTMISEGQFTNALQYDPLQLSVEEVVENKIDVENLHCELPKLSQKEQYVLQKRYVQQEECRVIGKKMGISKQAVSKMEKKAIEKLQFVFTHPELKEKITDLTGWNFGRWKKILTRNQ